MQHNYTYFKSKAVAVLTHLLLPIPHVTIPDPTLLIRRFDLHPLPFLQPYMFEPTLWSLVNEMFIYYSKTSASYIKAVT